MDEDISMVCLGDSLTAGSPGFTGYGTWSGNEQSQYEYWLEKKIESHFPDKEVEILNFGVGGNVVWQMYYRFLNDVLRLVPNPTYVLVFAGINDLLGTATDSSIVIEDLKELYETIIAKGGKVIPMEVAPSTATKHYVNQIKKTNKGIHQLANEMSLDVVPIYSALVDSDDRTLKKDYDIGDGLHFSVAGYKKIGETIFDTVMKSTLSK
jgi:lysophospholipase L1-like esterase